MSSEIVGRADFSGIRYAQCWEDADILLEALNIQPGACCLSIASAGDNTLALLAARPRKVIALDLSEAQLCCLRLKMAAYRCLSHRELLELNGSVRSERRQALYLRLRSALDENTRIFWDRRTTEICEGTGNAGKFERYFRLFRCRMMPLVHRREVIKELLEDKSEHHRLKFYSENWDTWRWRLMFSLFFSRAVLGRLGRDPGFFEYVEGSVADRVLRRTRYALTRLNTAKNPYLQWILTGRHIRALPFALRKENFEIIRDNLDKIQIFNGSVEDYLDSGQAEPLDAWNLSNIFEYMSSENYHALLKRIVAASTPGARLAYWNLFALRSRPEKMASELKPLTEHSEALFNQDKAFFYSKFVVEQVVADNTARSGHNDKPEIAARSGHNDKPDYRLKIRGQSEEGAECSLWWKGTPLYNGLKVGYIGHYNASSPRDGIMLLEEACEHLESRGCELAIGPVDGSTWMKYRFVTDSGNRPPFFLEPWNHIEYPNHFLQARFDVLERYHSSITADLNLQDHRIERTRKRLGDAGINVRTLNLDDYPGELARIHHISINSFVDNVLYSPISLEDMIGMYMPLKDYIRPELVLIAERGDEPAGFVFNIPDYKEKSSGDKTDTLILKTVAVKPGRIFAGLGTMLVADSHALAEKHGFSSVIHALMHSTNNSKNISAHYAEPFRHYALFARKLN